MQIKSRETNIFETRDADLASFLMYEGIELLEYKRDSFNPRIIVVRFLDPLQKCMDLERSFLSSEFKKYREINKYLLGKIKEKLRE